MLPRMLLVALCLTALYISCTEGAGFPNCINPRTCEFLRFGQYRDCRYCNTFIKCSNGIPYTTICDRWETSIYDFVKGTCTIDTKGECTRRLEYVTGPPEPTVIGPPRLVCPMGRNPCCITSCKTMPGGEYGSCRSCNGIAYCSNGRLIEMACPPPLVWDDELKTCNYESSTCSGPYPTVQPNCTVTIECTSEAGSPDFDNCLEVPKGTRVIGLKPIPFGGPGAPFRPVTCAFPFNFGFRDANPNNVGFTNLYTRFGCCAKFTLDVCPPSIEY